MAYTTIQISAETRRKLSQLKASERETYDELLNSLISLVPEGDDEGKYTPEFRASLLRSLQDIRAGRVHTLESVKKELGL